VIRAYVTGMCTGQMRSVRGKFHHHCEECPGFGECIGDCREAHCEICGEHYFQGYSGMDCECMNNDDDINWGVMFDALVGSMQCGVHYGDEEDSENDSEDERVV